MNSIKYSFLRKKKFSQKNIGYIGTYETKISSKFMKFGIIHIIKLRNYSRELWYLERLRYL